MDRQLELIDAISQHNQAEQDRINLAEANKNVGMALAAEHAEDVHHGWKEQAYRALIQFLAVNPGITFQTEVVRAWAERRGLPRPPSERAFGSVIVKAARNGLIKSIGYGKTSNPKSHRTPASVWRQI